MNDRELKRNDALKRTIVFGHDNAKDFPEGTEAVRWFKELEVAVSAVGIARTQQQGGRATARSVLLDALRFDVKNIARTAREIDEDAPGFGDNFHLPANGSQTALLTTAGRMLGEMRKKGVAEKFLPYEMPEAFVQDLEDDLTTIDETKDDQDSDDTNAVANTAALSKAIADGLRLLRKLNATMNNKYSHDPVKLAAWNTASHVERAPRRGKSSPATDDTQPTTGGETSPKA